MSTGAETTIPTVMAQSQPPPPIIEVFQFAYRFTTSAAAFLWTVIAHALTVLRTASSPFTALGSVIYKPISYLLAPFLLAVNIVLDVFIMTPSTILSRVLSDVYPIYAFVVVSCIFAAFIGTFARGVSYVISSVVAPSTPSANPAPSAAKVAKNNQPRAARKVTIKEEYS